MSPRPRSGAKRIGLNLLWLVPGVVGGSEEYTTRLLGALMDLAPDDHPITLRSISRRPSETERRRFLELQRQRDLRAAELGIDSTLIASRATLSDLAHDWEKYSPELMVWQRALLVG